MKLDTHNTTSLLITSGYSYTDSHYGIILIIKVAIYEREGTCKQCHCMCYQMQSNAIKCNQVQEYMCYSHSKYIAKLESNITSFLDNQSA